MSRAKNGQRGSHPRANGAKRNPRRTDGADRQWMQKARQAIAVGDLLTAEVLCENAIQKAPNDPAALEFRVRLFGQRGLYLRAVQHIRPLVARYPSNRALQRLQAEVVRLATLHQEAIGLYDALLQSEPNDIGCIEGICPSLVMTGQLDRARTLIDSVFASGQATPALCVTQVRVLLDSGEPDRALEAASRHLTRSDLRDRHRRRLHSAKGKALERLGRYDEAFVEYSRASQFERVPFDRKAYRNEVDALIKLFTPEWFECCPRAQVQNDQMIFIVGMPRSGSTLTERILDAHPQVRAIGEHPAMFEVLHSVKMDLNFIEPWPERVRRLSPESLTALGEDYLAQISQSVPRESGSIPRLVDKALWNTHALGLIAMILPKSRILWARRDPADSCISCFSEAMEPNWAPYGSDLQDLAFVHNEIDRLMRHWQQVLPIPLRLMQYEEMVADQEAATRGLLDFLGLPWHDDCLHFHTKASASATLSYQQVRRPVYKSSLGRAGRFDQHLAPLRAALAVGTAAENPH